MTDRMRTIADDALAFHKQATDYALEQSKLVQKQMQQGFDVARASMELTRDLQQHAVKTTTDAWMPAADAK